MRAFSQLIIEFHDDEVSNERQGTLAGRVGHQGTIAYAYQAEMYLQDTLEPRRVLRRAYVFDDPHAAQELNLLAVIGRDASGQLQYIARHEMYDGVWELPFADPDAPQLLYLPADDRLGTGPEVSARIAEQFATHPEVSTVVLVDDRGLVAAWERETDGVVLVARGPRRSTSLEGERS